MASISINIDTRRATIAGLYPLKICISHNAKKAYILTGIKLRADQWRNGQIVNHPQKAKLNSMIRIRMAELEQNLFTIGTGERLKAISAHMLRDRLQRPADEQGGYACLIEWWNKAIESKTAESTRKLYLSHRCHMEEFCAERGMNADTLSFESITEDTLRNLNAYLEGKGLSQNTRADFFTKMASVFNFAISHKVLSKDFYPFSSFSVKRSETRKRNMDVTEIRAMLKACHDGSIDNPNHLQAIKLFALSFYLIGMNSTDLYHLSGKDISNGRIQYYRAKTKRLYDIRIEPEAQRIIDEIGDMKAEHLFPWVGRYKDSYGFASSFTSYIKEISRKMFNKTISVYWARHTWATIASELDIPKETISASLGHGSKSVTDVYINFNARKIDDANRRVIDCALGIQ